MVNRFAAAWALGAALLAGPALAQSPNLRPSFGVVTLGTGFQPDPRRIEVTAGGPIDAEQAMTGDCTGHIAQAPDLRLNFTAGSRPLYLGVQSRTDTTLIVRAPDGSWLCNDDFIGFDPGLVITRPASGVYDIWIGVFGGGARRPARLVISETAPTR